MIFKYAFIFNINLAHLYLSFRLITSLTPSSLIPIYLSVIGFWCKKNKIHSLLSLVVYNRKKIKIIIISFPSMTQAACLLAFLCFVLLLSYIHSITVTKELIRIILHTQGRKEGRSETWQSKRMWSRKESENHWWGNTTTSTSWYMKAMAIIIHGWFTSLHSLLSVVLMNLGLV